MWPIRRTSFRRRALPPGPDSPAVSVSRPVRSDLTPRQRSRAEGRRARERRRIVKRSVCFRPASSDGPGRVYRWGAGRRSDMDELGVWYGDGLEQIRVVTTWDHADVE